MKKLSILAAAAAMAVVGLCASAQAAVVTYELNTPGEMAGAFHTPYTGTVVTQSATGGLGGSGALNFRSGNGSQAWYSNASYAPLAVGDILSVSLYFQIAKNSTSSIKLGFASDPLSAVGGTAVPNSGSWAYLGAWTNSAVGNLDYEVQESSNTMPGQATSSQNFVDWNWYKQELTMTKTAASTFTLAWAVYNSASDGTVSTPIISPASGTFVNAAVDTTMYAFIGLENPTPSASHVYIDRISMTSTGAIAVPEPTSLGLLGLGAAALLRRRRATKA